MAINLQAIISHIVDTLNKITFPLGSNEISLSYLFQIIIYLIIIAILSSYFNRLLRRKILKTIVSEYGIRYVFASLISYGIGAFCFIIILQTTGFNVSALTFLGGGIGIGIGLGLQGVTKNLVSGLSVLLERKIKIGHFIQFNDIEGYITEISTRSAIVKLENGSSVIVPNRNLIDNQLVNYHYKTEFARLDLCVRVPYECDPVFVTETLLICAYSDPHVRQIPPCQVIFKGFGESCLAFDLWVWINSDDMGKRFEIKSSLYFAIEYSFRQRNIKIPLAQRELFIKNSELVNSWAAKTNSNNRLLVEENTHLQAVNEFKGLSIKTLLLQVNYFKTLDDLQIRKIIEIGNTKRLKKSEILFREDDPGDAFYIILSGSVEIFTEKLGKTLAILQSGQFFGELALMLGIPRTATVKAIEETLLFSIHKQQFEKLLRNYPNLSELIIQELEKNQEELQQRKAELQQKGLLEPDDEHTNIIDWVRQRLHNILTL